MKQRTIVLLLILLLCLPYGVVAQDDPWTCDDGPGDALNAAQMAYDAGELDHAHELALIAEEVCATNSERYNQALSLQNRIEQEQNIVTHPVLEPDWPIMTIINRSQITICEVYVREKTSTQQGPNWLDAGESILPGGYRFWQNADGTYDVALKDCTGMSFSETAWQQIEIYWREAGTGPPPAQPDWPVLEIRNHTSRDICSVHVKPTGTDEWSSNWLLPNEIIPAGGSISWHVEHTEYNLAFFDCWGERVDDTAEEYVETVVDVTALRGRSIELNNQGQMLYRQGLYAEALAAYAEALSIAREIRDRQSVGIILNNIAAVYKAQGQYAIALDYYQQALDIVREVDDRETEGNILNSIGGIYHEQGQYDTALNYFQEALNIAREVDDQAGEGYALHNIGQVYHAQGQYGTALDYYQEALNIVREVDDWESEGNILNSIGGIYHEQGLYAAALDHYDQALDIARKVTGPAREGTCLNNIGSVYHSQGQYTLALDIYSQALGIWREIGARADEGTTLNNIAAVHHDQGQYATALDNFRQALAIHRELGDRASEGTTLNNIGAVYGAEGQYATALDYFQQALAVHHEVGDRAGEGETLNNIGELYRQQGQYIFALDYFIRALDIRREVGDRAGEGATLNNIGLTYYAQEQYGDALDYYQQALDIQREIGERVSEAGILNNIGGVYMDHGQYALALDYYMQALDIVRAIGYRAGEIVAFNNCAVAMRALGRIDEAIENYAAAVALIDSLTNDAALDEAITALRTQFQNNYPYQRLPVLLAQRGDYESALDYAERGRAILTRTELSTDSIDFRAELEDAVLLTTETDLRLSLDSAQNYLDSLRRDTSASQDDIVGAQTKLDGARRSYEQHLSLMQLQGGYLAREITREAAPLADIQAALPAETTLLLYTLGSPDSVVFLVTTDTLAAITLDVDSDTIGEQVTTFASDRRANADALRKLYDLVFAPVADQITTSRLIIAPDRALNYVPFAALQAPDGSYLIDHYSISMVSSGTTLVLLNDRAQQAQVEPTSPALVLAQPAAPGLPTLRNAPLEALDVADLLGAEPNLNATEADLRANVPGSAVLYITAHAELDRFAPLFSLIHLGAGGDYDGRLEVREIYELDLTQGTELVVLSGCETASGGDGEDFGLLTRAFFAAGAPRVVASLWSVDDAATADLMTAYIAERANYDNDADALRAAMLVMREQYPEPYYWASFVLSGLP